MSEQDAPSSPGKEIGASRRTVPGQSSNQIPMHSGCGDLTNTGEVVLDLSTNDQANSERKNCATSPSLDRTTPVQDPPIPPRSSVNRISDDCKPGPSSVLSRYETLLGCGNSSRPSMIPFGGSYEVFENYLEEKAFMDELDDECLQYYLLDSDEDLEDDMSSDEVTDSNLDSGAASSEESAKDDLLGLPASFEQGLSSDKVPDSNPDFDTDSAKEGNGEYNSDPNKEKHNEQNNPVLAKDHLTNYIQLSSIPGAIHDTIGVSQQNRARENCRFTPYGREEGPSESFAELSSLLIRPTPQRHKAPPADAGTNYMVARSPQRYNALDNLLSQPISQPKRDRSSIHSPPVQPIEDRWQKNLLTKHSSNFGKTQPDLSQRFYKKSKKSLSSKKAKASSALHRNKLNTIEEEKMACSTETTVQVFREPTTSVGEHSLSPVVSRRTLSDTPKQTQTEPLPSIGETALDLRKSLPNTPEPRPILSGLVSLPSSPDLSSIVDHDLASESAIAAGGTAPKGQAGWSDFCDYVSQKFGTRTELMSNMPCSRTILSYCSSNDSYPNPDEKAPSHPSKSFGSTPPSEHSYNRVEPAETTTLTTPPTYRPRRSEFAERFYESGKKSTNSTNDDDDDDDDDEFNDIAYSDNVSRSSKQQQIPKRGDWLYSKLDDIQGPTDHEKSDTPTLCRLVKERRNLQPMSPIRSEPESAEILQTQFGVPKIEDVTQSQARPINVKVDMEALHTPSGARHHSASTSPASRPYPHRCTKCCAIFYTESGLNRHMQTHDEPKPQSCRYCGQVFCASKPGDLKRHVKEFHSDAVYKCTSGKFSPEPELGSKIKCPFCGRVCESQTSMMEHFKEVHPLPEFLCDSCGDIFESQKLRDEHVIKVHHSICDFCGSDFPSEGRLRLHRQLHGIFECTCHKKFFPNEVALKDHLIEFASKYPSKQHTDISEISKAATLNEPGKIGALSHSAAYCEVCGDEYTDQESLRTHKFRHGIYECMCHKDRFFDEETLQQHEIFFSAVTPEATDTQQTAQDYSSKSYSRGESNCGSNPATPELSEQFLCTVCKEKLEDKDSLLWHQQVHGIYQCRCHRFFFPDRWTLKLHEGPKKTKDISLLKGYPFYKK